jgi:hypothetical protein
LYLAAQAGVAADFEAGLWQLRVGPELSVPQLGGLPISLGLGYQEEAGWLRGRHGYLQLGVRGGRFLRVLTRTSWFQQQGVTGSLGLASNELGASVALEVTPWRFLQGRVVLVGRLPLASMAPLGSLGVQLGGAF